jgi:17beta-estradiol 17-dehydrogenase / very-long-chain 3-oxoacyl-CoA reductase
MSSLADEFTEAPLVSLFPFLPNWTLIVIAGTLGFALLALLLARTVRFFFTQYFRQPHDLLKRYSGATGSASWDSPSNSDSRQINTIKQGEKETSSHLVTAPAHRRSDTAAWAVVTGASGGIGRGFAVELGRRGFNVCLISRSLERLEDAASEVRRVNPNVRVKLVTADFRMAHDHIHRQVPSYESAASGGPSGSMGANEETNFTTSSSPFWTALMRDLADISDNIAVLVNNVGINHTEPFTSIPEDFLFDIIAVNCTAQMLLTRKLIGKMLARRDFLTGQPARSAVISISSVAGQRPLLYLSPYSATKAFNDFFSRSLSLEFGHQIDFLSLRAGYVASNMSKLTETGGFVLDRYECAVGCLEKLGYVTETYGDPRHAVYARSFFLIPEALMTIRRRQRLNEKTELSAKQRKEPKVKTQ